MSFLFDTSETECAPVFLTFIPSPWSTPRGKIHHGDTEILPSVHPPRFLRVSVVNWYLQSTVGGRLRLMREQAYCVGLEGLLELRSPQPDRPAGSCCRAER